MIETLRYWRWNAVLAAVVVALASGCNPFLAPYFFLLGVEQKEPAECPLAAKDKDGEEEVTVVILTSNGLETRPEFLRADYEISRMLTKKLEASFLKNKEKVKIVAQNKVNKFKDDHPSWQSMRPAEIGEKFEADYVISMEIDALSLYQQGSGNSLFKGHAAISVDVVDVSKPDDGPIFRKEYTCDYPNGREVPIGDTHPQQFKLAFYNKITTQLAWVFTAHPTDEVKFGMD